MLTISEQTNIDKARILIDEYRKNHATLTKDKEAVAFDKFIKSLNALGFVADEGKMPNEAIDKFFEKSEVLNIETLGYKDKADFDKTATPTDKTAIITLWK